MEDNGILAKVPGPYVAEATQTLPDPEMADDRLYEVEIEAGHAGWVRIYAKRQKARHNKRSHWFWVAVKAEPLEQ